MWGRAECVEDRNQRATCEASDFLATETDSNAEETDHRQAQERLRLKTLKRSLCGRASFDLLRTRILTQSSMPPQWASHGEES